MDIIKHYDMLIDEENDLFRDPPVLQEYMNKWDGQIFLDFMQLDKAKTVLEIGVGTGRIAAKVAPNCFHFTGIDISPKTIERARINLAAHSNIFLVCDDFLNYRFETTFDVVYSSLIMMHFEDKQKVIEKVDSLLKNGGVFCLSIDKNKSNYIDLENRKVTVFPDTTDNIIFLVEKTKMEVVCVKEIENTFIIVCNK